MHAVEKVLFNPTREFELASCGDSTVRFWDTRTRAAINKVDVGGDPFTLSWSVDGSALLVGLKVSLSLEKRRLCLTSKERCAGTNFDYIDPNDHVATSSTSTNQPNLLF